MSQRTHVVKGSLHAKEKTIGLRKIVQNQLT